MVLRWASEHDDELDVYWVDSVKGGWRLVKRAVPTHASRGSRTLQRAARLLNPHPAGLGLTPVRR